MSAQPLILNFKDIDKRDIPLVGGKGANIGEMTKAGFPVPHGFAVTVAAYEEFLEENKIIDEINEKLKGLNVHEPEDLDRVARSVRAKITKGSIPDSVAKAIIEGYKKMGKGLVAVRSSATAEDLPGASFAGQQETFLNVEGEANLIDYVRQCWASLFTARAIFYRVENKFPHEKVKISVIVQRMVQSDVSGNMFTVDPVTNDKERIVIEAVWGLGEMMVQGSVVPDSYTVQKDTFSILSKEVSDQDIQLIKSGKETKEIEVPIKDRETQKLTDEQIVKLAKIGQKIQDHYYFPQDIEWAREKGEIYITQTRPITTLDNKAVHTKIEKGKDGSFKVSNTPILTGAGASPGIAIGHVTIIKSAKEIGKVKSGDVLVSEMTSPDFVPAMKRAAAIVTDKGGQTSHAAIVSRELGIPCIVGTKEATTKLKDGTPVTVDGSKGMVYMGTNVKIDKSKDVTKEKIITQKTATKIYVNLAESERVDEISKRNVDGIGLLRAEFMIAGIGVHPKEAIKKKEQDKFVDRLAKDMSKFAKPFGERPVVYRATDFKTNEYRQLEGGKAWEPEEENPMMGYRGAFRYIADPEVFTLELRAMKKVREKHKNLYLMIPYVRSPQELASVRRIVATEGLFEDPTFKFWMMVELPINVILIKDFLRVGIDGVSIGSNDLSMLTLGTDRDNADVAGAFDETSPSLIWSLKRVIKACNEAGVTASICGQAPSNHDELLEKLVKLGIASISVNPDAINRARGVVAKIEKEIATKSKG